MMTQRIEEYIGRKVIVEPECLKDSPVSGTYRIELSDEEIIRCRDCKMSKGEDDGLGICPFYVGNPNGFCSWAERSE